MINNQSICKRAFCWMGALAIILASPLSYAQDPVTVTALAVHSAGSIQYTYQVSNHTSARNIYTLSIGNRGDKSDDPATQANEQPELSVYPTDSYWEKQPDEGDSHDVSLRMGGIFTSPYGWNAHILEYEQTRWPGIESKFSIGWNLDESNTKTFPVIYPSQTFRYSVTVPQRDPLYLNGHFTVGFDDNEKPGTYTGPIVPIDTTPPTLSVTLNPATLWPPNDKLVSITASLTVKDDYDPEPEIKLESITASETLADGDIQDAQFSTDDRSFSLVAKHVGTNQAGRIYTVTYSATDASGNKTTASATVIVAHDQGK
jgi:hypothetical protein